MHVFGISARSVQGQIQGGAKIGQEGPPSSKNFFRLQSANRMHSDDLKASEKKYCSFWLLLLLVFKSVICVCIGTLLNRKFYWSCRIFIKKILQDLLMILLCPVQGPWASSLSMKAEIFVEKSMYLYENVIDLFIFVSPVKHSGT